MNVEGVIGEVPEWFMALRFVVVAGSYDYEDGELVENVKHVSDEMDYYQAKDHARSVAGYVFKRMETVTPPCKTCGGSKRIPTLTGLIGGRECPDCVELLP